MLRLLHFFAGYCLVLLLSHCSHVPYISNVEPHPFLKQLDTQPQAIWNPQIALKTKQTLRAYEQHLIISSPHSPQLEYGQSVRLFNLTNKTLANIQQAMKQLHCTKKLDHLKNSTTQAFIRDSSGNTIPMLLFLCPDGGVVRVKPQGDPTSKFRPQPHASKALRYPFNSPFKNFDDEIVKIDNQGYAVPKWIKDLNIPFEESELKQRWIQDWADDAHTNLPPK